MTAIKVNETPDGRGLRYGSDGSRSYTRIFRVKMDITDADPFEAIRAVGINMGDWYKTDRAYDTGAIVTDIDPTHDAEDLYWWTVRVEYASRTADPNRQGSSGGGGGGGGGEGPPNDDPLLEKPRWQWNAIHDTVVLDVSFDTPPKPLCNSAGQPFQPRPKVDRSRPSVTYVRNQATFDPVSMFFYWDRVNEKPFLGFAPRCVKCVGITAQKDYRNRQPFYVVTYQFEMRLPNWDCHLIDQGTRIKSGNMIMPVISGLPVGVIYLDGAGKERDVVLPDGVHGPTLEPIVLDFKAYPEVDFTPLDINLI